MPKVFLSFATADLNFIVKLYSRLKRLGIDIWDYSNRQTEIKLGDSILESLEKRVSESDFFIPVISNNSTDEERACIQFEVCSAIRNQKTCLPVIIQSIESIKWAVAFKSLKELKGIEIGPAGSANFEEGISKLCESLGVSYEPDKPDPHWLPLFKNLEREIDSQFDQLKAYHARATYDDLMLDVREFNSHYSAGHWAESLERIELILQLSRIKLKVKLYWPLIAKGACELQLNFIDRAEKTFLEAIASENAEENASGGLGQVYFIFKIALSKCPVGMEAEIVYNIILTAAEILSSQESEEKLIDEATGIINDARYLHKLNELDRPTIKDKLRTQYLIGLALLKGKNYREAYTCFSDVYSKVIFRIEPDLKKELNAGIISENLHNKFRQEGFLVPVGIPIQSNGLNDTGVLGWVVRDELSIYSLCFNYDSVLVYYRELSFIIHFSELLELIGEASKALKLMESEAIFLNEKLLFHHFANLLIREGCVNKAGEVYRKHLCQPPFDKQYLVEYALVLKHLHQNDEMKLQCEMAINSGESKDRRGYYYDGFAYFLLNKPERAKFNYELSRSYAEYYSRLI